jgi:hypothetical protein
MYDDKSLGLWGNKLNALRCGRLSLYSGYTYRLQVFVKSYTDIQASSNTYVHPFTYHIWVAASKSIFCSIPRKVDFDP